MADGRVKAKSGAYDEAAGLSVIADASDVHRPDRRGQDLFQRFFWICGESQASGQIVAGAKRDIAQFVCDRWQIPFSASFTVPSPPRTIRIWRAPSEVISFCNLCGMRLVSGKMHLIGQFLLIQKRS